MKESQSTDSLKNIRDTLIGEVMKKIQQTHREADEVCKRAYEVLDKIEPSVAQFENGKVINTKLRNRP